MQPDLDGFTDFNAQIINAQSKIDFSAIAAQIDQRQWFPENLHGLLLDFLDNFYVSILIVKITFEEGILLSWILRAEIVVALVESGTPQERIQIL